MITRILLNTLFIGMTLILSGCDSADLVQSTTTEGNNVLDGKAKIVFPGDFIKMSSAMMNVKYSQSAQRPQEVWYAEKEDGKVSIAFSETRNAMTEDKLPLFAKMMKTQLSALSPEISDISINGKKMFRIEMTTPSQDENIFNVMQLSVLEGKLLITTFNVTEDLKEKYLQSGIEALSTLQY